MNRKQGTDPINAYIPTIIAGILFILLIILILTVDVAPIGPNDTTIGLSHINDSVHRFFGVNMIWYDITKILGAIAIALAMATVAAGAYQLITRKSLKKVDREIYALGALYAAVVFFYVLFEFVIINYRPVIMPGDTAPEASFPSTHTMIGCTVVGALVMLTDRYVKNARLCLILRLFGTAIIVMTVMGRLISGVHWFTDILGGVLLSIILLNIFKIMAGNSDKTDKTDK